MITKNQYLEYLLNTPINYISGILKTEEEMAHGGSNKPEARMD